MILRRPSKRPVLRLLGIVLLIPGLLRVPLPQVDYHNIRHHDGAGEVCVYHDHLLRWHPTAGRDDDVALLHWHWLVPQSLDSDESSSSGEDRPAPTGPAIHAHLLDALEPEWTAGALIRPDGRGRSLLVSSPGYSGLQAVPGPFLFATFTSRTSGMPGLPDAAFSSLIGGELPRLQRWNC